MVMGEEGRFQRDVLCQSYHHTASAMRKCSSIGKIFQGDTHPWQWRNKSLAEHMQMCV